MSPLFFWIWVILSGTTAVYVWILIRRKTKYSLLSLLFRISALLLIFWLSKVTFLKSPTPARPLFVLVDSSLSMQKLLKLPSKHSSQSLEGFLKLNLKDLLSKQFSDYEPQYIDLFPDSKIRSALATSILQFIQDSRLKQGSDILLLSDGWDTEQKSLSSEISKKLSDSGVTIHTAWFRRSTTAKDLSFKNVGNPRIVFVNTPTQLSATISSSLQESTLAHVILSDGQSILSEREIQIEAGIQETPVTLNWTPLSQGKRLLQLRILPLKGEENIHNNLAYLPMNTRPKKLRVLHIAGRPSWDVIHLRRLLKSIPEIDMVAFFILRDPYADVQNVPESELSLIQFPVRELFLRELFKFDRVIFHNFDINKYLNNPQFQKSFQRYLAGGKGIIVVGGEQSLNKRDYQRLFLKQTSQSKKSSKVSKGVSQIFHQKQWNLQNNKNIPDLHLSQQSSFSGIPSSQSSSSQTSVPLLQQTSFQLGRVDWVSSASLWKWQHSGVEELGNNGSFALFWLSLLYRPMFEEAQIFKDFQQLRPYSSQDSIFGTLHLPSLEATSVRVELIDTQLKHTIWKKTLTVSKQQAELKLPALSEGSYDLKVSCECSDMKAQTHALNVVNEWIEFQQATTPSGSNLPWLKKLAQQTGGQSWKLP